MGLNTLIFMTLDEIIEDLKSDHPGKKMNAINRIVGMRNKKFKLIRNRKFYYDDYILDFYNYDRIVRRLYADDINGSIIMIRELQNELEDSYINPNPAWYRFLDWKMENGYE